MFIWDSIAETALGQIINWIYGQIVGFLGDSFIQMGSIGADLFVVSWVQSIVLFFSYLVWAFYVTGLVVAMLECGIDHQAGRGSVKETTLNIIEGFLTIGLLATIPVELYKLCISLQGSFTTGITGLEDDFGAVAIGIVNSLKDVGTWEVAAASRVLDGLTSITNPVLMMLILTLMGYAIIEMFFADLRWGGTLLIQITVGSLHMLNVPRGYIDGFVSWSRQVIGLYLTAFLQTTVLVAGLMMVRDRALLGLGLMLSVGEIPRIVGQFGLDTTTRANVMGAVYVAQSVVNLTGAIVQTVAK